MTTGWFFRQQWAQLGLWIALLAACSVDRAPLSRGDGGGVGDASMMDAQGFDAANDAMQGTDAPPDAPIDDDAGDLDAGSLDGGNDGAILSCMLDDDCDPRVCHEANCNNGTCSYTSAPFGIAPAPQLPHDCQTVYCDGNGNLITLGDSLDPPLDDGDFCTLESCSNTMPVHVPLPDGTQLPPTDQLTGDCQVKRCMGGQTVDVIDDADRPTSSACEDGTCAGGVPGMTPRGAGLDCGTSQVCDGSGACVACIAQAATCSEDWQCCGGNCVGGQCGTACSSNYADCDGMDGNGCETMTNTLSNCGACGTTCNLANANETCATGTCTLAGCNAGFGDCNNSPGDGCEQSLRSLVACGTCGTPCARANATTTCVTGTCSLGPCNAGFGNCDSNPVNGCETALNSLTHCGACGTTCMQANAVTTCSSGMCQRVSCAQGFDDCDNSASNGCEADLGAITSCGSCGTTCTGPANREVSCDAGVCNVGACLTGYQDCDGMSDNGCEWNTNAGPCPCTGDADTDGDGLTNCNELDDDDAFTDPDIFNGASVTHYPLCATGFPVPTVSCNDYDTLDEVTDCVNRSARQSLNQYSGWDFNDPSGSPNAINTAGFGFLPNWSGNNTSFQLDARAFINVTQSGRHCFRVNGGSGGTCGSLYLATTAADAFCGWGSVDPDTQALVQHGDDAVCVQLSAGVYPIRWHLDRTAGAQGDFHLDYCYGGNADCSPVDAIPRRQLRVSYDAECDAPATACTQDTFNNKDYWFCDDALTWTAARNACQSVGMDLAVINNGSENTFLTGAIGTDSWIALSDSLSESNWMWMTNFSVVWTGGPNGTQVASYVNWADGDPNGDNTRNCGELMTDGEWNDTTCGTAQAFVCESL